jgi:hypothetical protein
MCPQALAGATNHQHTKGSSPVLDKKLCKPLQHMHLSQCTKHYMLMVL